MFRLKFEQLQEPVNGSIEIVISETKIYETFQNHTGLTENVPRKILRLHSFADDIESIIFAINRPFS